MFLKYKFQDPKIKFFFSFLSYELLTTWIHEFPIPNFHDFFMLIKMRFVSFLFNNDEKQSY